MSGTVNTNGNEPVLIFEASTQEEAEVVRATLAAAGISAVMEATDPDPIVGAVDPAIGATWSRRVYVRQEDVEASTAILSDRMSEEDLVAEAQADETTLEAAEKRAKSL